PSLHKKGDNQAYVFSRLRKINPLAKQKVVDNRKLLIHGGLGGVYQEASDGVKIKRNGGGGEIRTLDRLLTYAGFQDRCIQPLCHPSALGRHVTVTGGAFKPKWRFGNLNF